MRMGIYKYQTNVIGKSCCIALIKKLLACIISLRLGNYLLTAGSGDSHAGTDREREREKREKKRREKKRERERREKKREREKREKKREEIRCQTVTSAMFMVPSPGDINPFDSLCCWFWECKGLTWPPGFWKGAAAEFGP